MWTRRIFHQRLCRDTDQKHQGAQQVSTVVLCKRGVCRTESSLKMTMDETRHWIRKTTKTKFPNEKNKLKTENYPRNQTQRSFYYTKRTMSPFPQRRSRNSQILLVWRGFLCDISTVSLTTVSAFFWCEKILSNSASCHLSATTTAHDRDVRSTKGRNRSKIVRSVQNEKNDKRVMLGIFRNLAALGLLERWFIDKFIKDIFRNGRKIASLISSTVPVLPLHGT